MPKNVVRFADYEKRSREPDAAGPREEHERGIVIAFPEPRIDAWETWGIRPESTVHLMPDGGYSITIAPVR